MIILPGALPPGLSVALAGSPQGAALPWPEGSLLSARLLPAGDEGMARLLLGQHRMMARVPPNVPMGNVWLELLRREMPAQLRLLSEEQAAERLLRMLARARAPRAEARPAASQPDRAADAPSAASLQAAHAPGKHAGDGIAFLPTADPARWLIARKEDDAPGGMIRIERTRRDFLLEGRVDLERLGAVFFSLRGAARADAPPSAMKLTVQARSAETAQRLAPAMREWIEEISPRLPLVCAGVDAAAR